METWKDKNTVKAFIEPVISLCSSTSPCYCAPIFRSQSLAGYTGHKAGFHPITSGYMTQTLNLWENQSETSRDRCMKMAPVTFTRLTVSFQRLIGYDVTWTWPQEFDWRIRRNLAIKRLAVFQNLVNCWTWHTYKNRDEETIFSQKLPVNFTNNYSKIITLKFEVKEKWNGIYLFLLQ